MAKNGNVSAATIAADGPAQVAAVDDWRKLAKPLEAPKAREEVLFSGGHNCVIDRRSPDCLSLHIATDEEAMASMFNRPASKEKLKKEPDHPGSFFLAMTNGPMWGSIPVTIGNRRFFLKMTLEADAAE